MSRVVQESRAYDSRFDPSYTSSNIPAQRIAQDPRVNAAMSKPDVVAGSTRYKYFRRPVMPRLSTIPPQVLLAPTATLDPALPVEEKPEPATKTTEVQTMFRESEAQTLPYTPAHIIRDGSVPEVLLLKGLTYENGLSLGLKELEMIEYARMKRDVESNLPPFTDEASMLFRKKLMEDQEMREFKLRENEIDARREARIAVLQQALRERDESDEFLASQRVESIRQMRMEEREINLAKIRSKRIKALRKLANRRNQQNPQLSSTEPEDIIDNYFDKASETYAPVKRKGGAKDKESGKFDILSRTAPLSVLTNVKLLENEIPKKIMCATIELGIRVNPMEPPKTLADTGYLIPTKGGRAAEPRLTSAAVRTLRNQKRDVEEMARILAKQKVTERAAHRAANTGTATTPAHASVASRMGTAFTDGGGSQHDPASPSGRIDTTSSSPHKKVNARPRSPDYTRGDNKETPENQRLTIACVILQKLIRGRAVQNVMYESRYRRSELISELRLADDMERQKREEAEANEFDDDAVSLASKANAHDENIRAQREARIRETVIESAAGGVSSNLVYSLVQEKDRLEIIEEMKRLAVHALEERRIREAVEAGRRQREHMQVALPSEESREMIPVLIQRDVDRPPTPPTPRDDTAVDEFGISDRLLQNVVTDIVQEALSRASTPYTRPTTSGNLDDTIPTDSAIDNK